jgi:hypothetical protein
MIYHINWLEIALKKFKEQNQIVHVIDGNVTLEEFITTYTKEELSKTIRVT